MPMLRIDKKWKKKIWNDLWSSRCHSTLLLKTTTVVTKKFAAGDKGNKWFRSRWITDGPKHNFLPTPSSIFVQTEIGFWVSVHWNRLKGLRFQFLSLKAFYQDSSCCCLKLPLAYMTAQSNANNFWKKCVTWFFLFSNSMF